MADVAELGNRVKAKYPGAYDDMDPAELGRRIKAKYPGAYDDFADVAAGAKQQPVDANAKSVLDRKRSPGETTEAFLNGAWSKLNPVSIIGNVASAAASPIKTVGNIVDQHYDTAVRAQESVHSGDYLQGLRHGINAIIPLLGPALDQSQEKIREGDAAEGYGEVVGMLAAPKAVQGTARAIGGAARGVSQATKGIGGQIARKAVRYGVDKAFPGAGVILDGGGVLLEEVLRRRTAAPTAVASESPTVIAAEEPPLVVKAPAPKPEPAPQAAKAAPGPPEPPYKPPSIEQRMEGLSGDVQSAMKTSREQAAAGVRPSRVKPATEEPPPPAPQASPKPKPKPKPRPAKQQAPEPEPVAAAAPEQPSVIDTMREAAKTPEASQVIETMQTAAKQGKEATSSEAFRFAARHAKAEKFVDAFAQHGIRAEDIPNVADKFWTDLSKSLKVNAPSAETRAMVQRMLHEREQAAGLVATPEDQLYEMLTRSRDAANGRRAARVQ